VSAEARRLNKTFQTIRSGHRVACPAAQPPVAILMPVNERAIRARHRKQAVAGIALSNRAERAAAKERAEVPAEQEMACERRRLAAERDQAQARLDAEWARLGRNDAAAVLEALEGSFNEHGVPAAAVGVRGDEVELAVLVPPPSAVPEHMPVTEAGQLELKPLGAAERAGFYRELVAGRLLAAVRVALAAAPGLTGARAVAVRGSGPDAYGHPTIDCLMAARFSREALEGVRWADSDANRIVNDASTDLLVNPGGRSKELTPIDMAAKPALAQLVAKVDAAALAAQEGGPRPPLPSRPARTASGPVWPGGTPWPGMGRAKEVGVEWLGARSRGQVAALVAVVAFVLLGAIGALADTRKTDTTVDAGAPPEVVTTKRTTSTTLAVVRTTLTVIPATVAPARVAEGVPAGGDDTTVERVIDGDTIVVAGGTRIRLIGIDTPETVEPGTPVQCFGPEATRYANELMPVGTRIRLVYDVERLDRFGRSLAYVYKLDDGLFVNRAIARNGFAQQSTFPPNVAHVEEFRQAVAEARDANLGLWRGCQPTTTAAPATTAPRATTPPPTAAPPTRAPVVSATPCSASVSNASPSRNATVTVRITSEQPNTSTSATAHYKTTDTSHQTTTDGSGAAAIDFRISAATPGYRVVVDVTVGSSNCQTSFTPVG